MDISIIEIIIILWYIKVNNWQKIFPSNTEYYISYPEIRYIIVNYWETYFSRRQFGTHCHYLYDSSSWNDSVMLGNSGYYEYQSVMLPQSQLATVIITVLFTYYLFSVKLIGILQHLNCMSACFPFSFLKLITSNEKYQYIFTTFLAIFYDHLIASFN